jgi:D-sedoheptulose 7-phosphate isomerase
MVMRIKKAIQESIELKEKILQDEAMLQRIETVSDACVNAFKKGNQLLLCGNGGSAADAQHLAAEFSGRFYFDREPLNAEALHVNTSYLTAVANDYSYDEVYARLVKAKGTKGDVLFALSTSGNSENVIRAMKTARELGMITVALTGRDGGKATDLSDYLFNVPSNDTPRIQEAHILIGHLICELVESKYFPGK